MPYFCRPVTINKIICTDGNGVSRILGKQECKAGMETTKRKSKGHHANAKVGFTTQCFFAVLLDPSTKTIGIL